MSETHTHTRRKFYSFLVSTFPSSVFFLLTFPLVLLLIAFFLILAVLLPLFFLLCRPISLHQPLFAFSLFARFCSPPPLLFPFFHTLFCVSSSPAFFLSSSTFSLLSRVLFSSLGNMDPSSLQTGS